MPLTNEQSLDALLHGFRNGTLEKAQFNHAAHLAVAACYSLEFPKDDCLDHFRRDLKHFNESVGGANTEDAGYHETITIIWLDTIRAFLREKAPALSRIEAARLTVEEFRGRMGLPQTLYTFDLVKSREARARWIPPG